jgi:hypothetical protein
MPQPCPIPGIECDDSITGRATTIAMASIATRAQRIEEATERITGNDCLATVLASRAPGDRGRSTREERVSLDLDQHERVDQRLDLDHGGRGPNIAEILAVRAPVFLPARDIRHEHARANDISH